MSLPRYSEYKDSGVEWLGEVPGHWHLDRLKRSIVSCKNGIWGEEAQEDESDIPCVRVADFNRQRLTAVLDEPTIRNVTEKERVGRLLSKGDLLLEKSGGGENQPVGCVVLYDDVRPAVCSNFVARMQMAAGMDSSYWRYVHAAAYAIRLTTGSINQTSGIQNLDQDRYFNERVAFPPPEEQQTIAAFLDRETGKIDALIAEQRRLVELLAEKRQAVISHAVTKGLPSTGSGLNVRMKDSGIEWLGEVPEHWQIYRLGNLFREVAEEGQADRPILSVSIHDGVSDRELDDKEMDRKVTRSEDRGKYKSVEPSDLVYNMMRAWQGGFGTVEVPGMVSPAYVVARPRYPFSTEFIEQQLRTPQAVEEMRRYSRGVTDFRLRLYWDEFKSISVVMAPSDEQQAIAAFLDTETAKFDTLTAEANRAIALLQERRSALISAAVTGKIDVSKMATVRA